MSTEAEQPPKAENGNAGAIHFTPDAQSKSFVAKMAEKNSGASADVHAKESAEYSEYFKRSMEAKKEGVDDVEQEEKRKKAAPKMTKLYYDLVTDFYEYAWGDSFHFARMYKGDALSTAVKRHETYLAHKLEAKPGMKILDVGCGVGGPMREIARFSGANVLGINFNEHQVGRVNYYCKKWGLDKITGAVHGNFLDMPFENEQFDAAYSVEAACHAPKPQDVIKEIYRTLKPGGVYAAYEWCLTDKYDPNNKEHVDVMHELATGNSIPKWYTTKEWKDALEEVGFEVLEDVDLAYQDDIVDGDRVPWYKPLTNDASALMTVEGLTIGWLRMPWGRAFTGVLVRFLELIRLAPPGSTVVSDFLNMGAVALVRSGELEIFTPMYCFKARKPLTASSPKSPEEAKVGGI